MDAYDSTRRSELLCDRRHQRTQQADARTDGAEIGRNTRTIGLRGRADFMGPGTPVNFRGRNGYGGRRRRGKPLSVHMAKRDGQLHGKRGER
jgi:hypothetical protein